MAAQGKSVSLERLEQILPAAYDKYQLLVPALELMVHHRIETLKQLNYVADKLDERRHKGNVAKVVGAAVSVTGSATAAVGAAASPFTLGAGLFLVVGGATLAGLGSATVVVSQVAQKVHEKVDLEKIQQAIDRDKAQCKRVSKLWKEFDSYCVDAINTIALANPREESDILSLQTWIQVAMEEITSPVIFLAEAFQEEFSTVTDGILADKNGEELCKLVGKMARGMMSPCNPVKRKLKSMVSRIEWNFRTVAGTVAFLLISGIVIGNLFVLITTLIDIHKGSPSKVTKELCEHYKRLQEELDKWLDAFGNPRR